MRICKDYAGGERVTDLDDGSSTGVLRRRSFLKLAGLTGLAATAPSAALVVPGRTERLPQEPAALPDAMDRAGYKVRNLYLNQVGYRVDQAKVATVILVRDAALAVDPDAPEARPRAAEPVLPWTFEVHAVGGAERVLHGALSDPLSDPLAGDTVCFADLSALRTPGRYRVSALGHTGDEFRVGDEVYGDPLRLAMRAYYGQRCGCKVDLGDGYKHKRCHGKGAFGSSSGRTGKLSNRPGHGGGWHDAGDYGRYVVNSGITCGTLLWAWELYPEVLRPLALALPESGRALPDFLAEVQWNLHWMLQMQDADGGVWHKQTSAHFCGFVMPEKDHLVSEVVGTGAEPYKSTCATADLAAVMAIAARCYRAFDAKFADRCLAAARLAFTWAEANPEVVFKNPPGITTGEYGDPHCADELLWAAAELFRTTGEPAFERAFLLGVSPGLATLRVQAPSWGGVASLGLWTYCFALGADGNQTCAAIRQATAEAAERLIRRSKLSAYGTTLARREFGWGSNSTAANQSFLLLMAERLQPGMPEARETALGNLHYLLGRNCFGVSWVTHVGVRPFLHPHHRPSSADKVAAPWPGLLSGGPNAHGGDAVADHLPEAAPMRMWLDDERAYSLNEIAINWNAPLVFLLAAAAGGG